MYFFAVVFIVIVIICLNGYAKRDPITKDKVSHRREFDKELCEPGEVFVLRTEIDNASSHSMGRIYLKHTLDEEFILAEEDKYKEIKADSKKQIVCKTHVKAKKTGVIETQFSIAKRGVYQTHNISIDCLDLFGFHTSYYDKPSVEKITIAPKRVDNKFMSKMIAQGYGDFNAKRGFIDDETTIRTYGEYTGHEPMRHINWKKSAQVDEFIVKQFEPMGTHVTTVVFDVTGYAHVHPGTQAYELLDYSISMLREMFEYFEAKRIAYCLYTNAKSSFIHEHTFSSVPSGTKTRRRMLCMLGELSPIPDQKGRRISSKELLDFAIKNSFRAPFAYVAPADRGLINVEMKKISKIKGIEIIELYADKYFKQQVRK